MKTIKLNSLWLLLVLSFELFLAVEPFGILVALLEKKKEIVIKEANVCKVINLVLVILCENKLNSHKSLHYLH